MTTINKLQLTKKILVFIKKALKANTVMLLVLVRIRPEAFQMLTP